MYTASGVVSTLYVLTLWFACATGGRLYDATERCSPGDAFQVFTWQIQYILRFGYATF